MLERRGVDGIILFAFNDLDYAAMAPLRRSWCWWPGIIPASPRSVSTMPVRCTMLDQLAARGIQDIAYLGWIPATSPPVSAGSTPTSAIVPSRGWRRAAPSAISACRAAIGWRGSAHPDYRRPGLRQRHPRHRRGEIPAGAGAQRGAGDRPWQQPHAQLFFPNALSLDLGYKGQVSRRPVSCSARSNRICPVGDHSPSHPL